MPFPCVVEKKVARWTGADNRNLAVLSLGFLRCRVFQGAVAKIEGRSYALHMQPVSLWCAPAIVTLTAAALGSCASSRHTPDLDRASANLPTLADSALVQCLAEARACSLPAAPATCPSENDDALCHKIHALERAKAEDWALAELHLWWYLRLSPDASDARQVCELLRFFALSQGR
jgi:hypothetical protein